MRIGQWSCTGYIHWRMRSPALAVSMIQAVEFDGRLMNGRRQVEKHRESAADMPRSTSTNQVTGYSITGDCWSNTGCLKPCLRTITKTILANIVQSEHTTICWAPPLIVSGLRSGRHTVEHCWLNAWLYFKPE